MSQTKSTVANRPEKSNSDVGHDPPKKNVEHFVKNVGSEKSASYDASKWFVDSKGANFLNMFTGYFLDLTFSRGKGLNTVSSRKLLSIRYI